MKHIMVRPATLADVKPTIDKISGTREIRGDPEKVLSDALKKADWAWVGTANGEIGCVWGLQYTNILLGHVYIWVLTTKVAEEHQFRFVRGSRLFVDQLKTRFPYICGWVDARNPKSVVWIKWLGFELGPVTDKKVRPFWIGER